MFSIGPTDPISGNAFDGKRRKKRGWPNESKDVSSFGGKWAKFQTKGQKSSKVDFMQDIR